jgi:hypothetical protein
MSPVDERVARGKAERESEVECAKCGHINQRRQSACQKCGAHLYVVCHHCGHRNQRALTQCDKCGEELHRSFLKRFWMRIAPRSAMVKPVHILLLIATVYLAYRIVVKLSNLV